MKCRNRSGKAAFGAHRRQSMCSFSFAVAFVFPFMGSYNSNNMIKQYLFLFLKNYKTKFVRMVAIHTFLLISAV